MLRSMFGDQIEERNQFKVFGNDDDIVETFFDSGEPWPHVSPYRFRVVVRDGPDTYLSEEEFIDGHWMAFVLDNNLALRHTYLELAILNRGER